ncbi:MAG: hypothetical protein H0V66_03930 [Bdellovibrionales bacterium]|nr:hypothetical protein [Bdellovibrionales bacterium]
MHQELLIIMVVVFFSVVAGIVGFVILHFKVLPKNLTWLHITKLLFSERKKICTNEEEIRKLGYIGSVSYY